MIPGQNHPLPGHPSPSAEHHGKQVIIERAELLIEVTTDIPATSDIFQGSLFNTGKQANVE